MIRIFQIYFKEIQKPHLDGYFEPYFNTATDVRLREWPVIRSGFDLVKDDLQKDPNLIWGFVSWKWKQKTFLPSKTFINWIENNPDNDVWYMEPNYSRSVYFNPWTQGNLCHRGIANIAQQIFTEMGWSVPDLTTTKIPFCWYNYFAGNAIFWTKYFSMMDQFIETAKNNPTLNNMVFEQSAQYGPDASIPYFIFLVERLFTTLLILDPSIRSAGLKYNHPAFNFG